MIPTLKHPAELRVLSNPQVVAKVRALQPTKASVPKAPTTIGDLDPTIDFAMRPFDMLLELGAATVPPLPDHLRLASRWALLRYGWALAAPSGPLSPLRLGVYGDKLRYHHRTLLSEEIGVGLACWTCSQLLGTRWPGAGLRRVDAEAALTPGAGPITVPGGAGVTVTSDGKRPDYFWIAYDPKTATVLEVVVLECKGTHDSRHVYKQLGDAMHQVAAVAVAGGGILTLQAFGAHLNNRRIQLYGLDPEGDEGLAGALAPRTTRTLDEPIVQEREDNTFEISQPAAFRRRLLDIAAGQLLCWAGLADAAQARLSGDPESLQIDLDVLAHRQTPIGTFVGISADFPIATGAGYEAFFGLDKRVATGLIADDDGAEAEAFEDFAQRAARPLAATRDLLDSAIEADVLSRAEAAGGDELEPSSAIQATGERPQAVGQVRRPGAHHVALDDPQDETRVAGATLDGLFLEVRARGDE